MEMGKYKETGVGQESYFYYAVLRLYCHLAVTLGRILILLFHFVTCKIGIKILPSSQGCCNYFVTWLVPHLENVSSIHVPLVLATAMISFYVIPTIWNEHLAS
jgi:hypothetical protein